MLLKNTFFIFILFLCFNTLNAQSNQLKSAKLAVDSLFFSDKEKALSICMENLPESYALKDTFHITYFLDQAGEINRYLGDLFLAKEQLETCLKYKKNWKDLKDLSLTHNNLGKTHSNMGNYDLSLFHYLKALKLMEQDQNLIGQGYYLNNIGSLFDLQHNYPKAISYYKKSLKIKHQIKDSSGIASTNLNIGISYFNLKEYETALAYFKKAYESESYQSNPTKKARALLNMAKVYNQQQKPKLAKEKLLTAYKERNKIDDQFLMMNIVNVISESYLSLKNIDSAKYFNELALDFTFQTGASERRQEALFQKSTLFEHLGQYDSALYYLQQGNLYFDSIVTEANIFAVNEMESKYNYERNLRLRQTAELDAAKTKTHLQQRSIQLLILVSVLILVLCVLIVFLVKHRSGKKENELIKGQNMLTNQQNQRLEEINNNLSQEFDTLKFSLNQKEELLTKVFAKSRSVTLPDELLALSTREIEVLANLALGLSDDQLAEKLFVSRTTIKTHLRRIYSKLLVRNRAEAVAVAHQYNLIGVPTVNSTEEL